MKYEWRNKQEKINYGHFCFIQDFSVYYIQFLSNCSLLLVNLFSNIYKLLGDDVDSWGFYKLNNRIATVNDVFIHFLYR